ncbi:hypothetical protein P4S85_18460, partial [Aneurinibacillus thermoaerophilus]|nr:hypothetical protein [Aneurinibacillus thermoaerophilus]
QKRDSYPKKLARNRIITGSNQLFETDIKYGYIEKTASFSSSPFWTYMTVRSLRIIWVCPVRQRMRVVRYNRHYLNGNYLEQIRFPFFVPIMARSLRLIILHKHVKRLELFMSVFRHEHRI